MKDASELTQTHDEMNKSSSFLSPCLTVLTVRSLVPDSGSGETGRARFGALQLRWCAQSPITLGRRPFSRDC